MNIYEAETPEERREAAIELCVASILRVTDSTAVNVTHVANIIVPPLPVQYNEVRVGPCVVQYRGGVGPWRVFESGRESTYCTVIDAIENHISPTEEELVELFNLKKNPMKSNPAPDADCVTLADGSCVSPKHCMHGPPYNPATVASEPVAFDHDTVKRAFDVIQKQVGSHALDYYIVEQALKAAQLHPHPATEAEALAVLVGLGWKELKGSDGLSQAFNELWKCRRVLIAPEGA